MYIKVVFLYAFLLISFASIVSRGNQYKGFYELACSIKLECPLNSYEVMLEWKLNIDLSDLK